jgi:pimeloyl-ACP methyl ester carboxylesterase
MAEIGGRRGELTLVAQSLAGFIAPLVAERAPVVQMVLLNAMVPRPGESAGEWWDSTGHNQARAEHYRRLGLDLPAEFDPIEAFFHDVPADVVAEAVARGAPTVHFDTVFSQPWPLPAWPKVATRFLQARDDRFFPLEFQRRIVAERLRIAVEELPGGHLVALSQPEEVAERLQASGPSGPLATHRS